MIAAKAGAYWLPRCLFWLTLAAATLLLLVLLVSPWIVGEGPAVGTRARVIRLFARDPVVRRTTLASAIGMIVSAFIFFRSGGLHLTLLSRSRKEPPANIAGA